MSVEIIGNATLYLGDCGAIMRTLPRVDAVVTDPPYGIGETNKRNLSRRNIAKPKNYGEFGWDQHPASDELITLIRQNSKHQIIFGGNYFTLPPASCWLVWDKLNGENDFADCELAWTNLPKAVRRIRHMWNGMLRDGDDIREHPTQKPLAVMKWCIGHLPKDVETICDPFMGSGTTGVAALQCGKRFIGIEREPKYFEIACKRLREEVAQPDMFVAKGE